MKVIKIVVDMMPRNCYSCWLIGENNAGENYCMITDNKFIYMLHSGPFPSNCPLELEGEK